MAQWMKCKPRWISNLCLRLQHLYYKSHPPTSFNPPWHHKSIRTTWQGSFKSHQDLGCSKFNSNQQASGLSTSPAIWCLRFWRLCGLSGTSQPASNHSIYPPEDMHIFGRSEPTDTLLTYPTTPLPQLQSCWMLFNHLSAVSGTKPSFKTELLSCRQAGGESFAIMHVSRILQTKRIFALATLPPALTDSYRSSFWWAYMTRI